MKTEPVPPDTLLATAMAWRKAGRRVAVATVIETWGSSPCPVGSQMIVADDGAIAGSVSGGCVEGAVVVQAHQAMSEGEPRRLRFGIADSDAWAVGLACGGTLVVWVEALSDGSE